MATHHVVYNHKYSTCDIKITQTAPLLRSRNHGRPQEFFQRGVNPSGLTKITYFSTRRRRERKFSRFFRSFRLNLRVIDASAEGASENFRVFSTRTAYDVIIFKFQGGGGQLPQVAPPPGAYEQLYSGPAAACFFLVEKSGPHHVQSHYNAHVRAYVCKHCGHKQ